MLSSKKKMNLHDIVLDTFGILPSDSDYPNRLKQIEFELTNNTTSKRQFDCINLYYFDGLKIDDVSKRLEIEKSTVSRHLSTFRERCKLKYLYSVR